MFNCFVCGNIKGWLQFITLRCYILFFSSEFCNLLEFNRLWGEGRSKNWNESGVKVPVSKINYHKYGPHFAEYQYAQYQYQQVQILVYLKDYYHQYL